MRSAALGASLRRLAVARVVLLAALALLGARAAQLAFDARSLERAEMQHGAWLRIAAERGRLLDRDGKVLAVSLDAPSVFARPREIADPDAAAEKLARALGIDRRSLAARLRRRSSYVFVARWVDAAQASRVRALALPGVGLADEPRRTYPHGPLAAPVLGFANIDGEGVRGIEQQEDAWLRGTPRVYRVERDARGGILGVAGVEVAAAAGGDVRLTLDAGFQADAEAALAQTIAATGARGGIVLTLDPRTGEILALAELPSFDPNHFRELDFSRTRSRAFQDALEPGSTFKTFVVAGALEAGTLSPHEAIDTEGGSYRVPGKTIRDLHRYGDVTPADLLRVSSNVGAVKVAQALGARRHYEILRAFGFGATTGSGFPFESAGLLRPFGSWRPVDQATVAFGQGVSVTPLQLTAAMAALANDGVLVRPRLVAARRRARGPWIATHRDPVRRVVSEETAREVVGMLEGVVGPGGTATRAALKGLRVAGKTGTAQLLDPATGRYATSRYHAWFVGIVPTDDPRLVILCELDEPRAGLHHGGSSAAPLFAAVASAQLARLAVATEPVRPWHGVEPPAVIASPSEPAAGRAALARLAVDGQRVFLPDFRGLSMAEVRGLTAGTPLAVEFVGTGRAVDQEPDPGTIVGAHRRVRIHFAVEGEEG